MATRLNCFSLQKEALNLVALPIDDGIDRALDLAVMVGGNMGLLAVGVVPTEKPIHTARSAEIG